MEIDAMKMELRRKKSFINSFLGQFTRMPESVREGKGKRVEGKKLLDDWKLGTSCYSLSGLWRST
jgi:hypothetical protein